MEKYIKFAKKAVKKSTDSIKSDGVPKFLKRSVRYVYYKKYPNKKPVNYKDILFINGCTLPHPERYRVDHQVEQLISNGMTVDSIFYDQLNMDMLKSYRGFVFFRCPITDTVKKFIEYAKQFNKTCFFDIDDLVIDKKYTDQIEYVKSMPKPNRELYDDGVNRTRQTLELCDYAITSTKRLKTELLSYSNEVFINRNVASDEMVAISKKAIQQVTKDDDKVIIGYFSGSITHNEDFEIVLPSLVRLFKKHKNLYVKIVGILDIPPQLESFKDRIINSPFMDWRLMSAEIAQCDINIAPLKNTIFNEAKSENKWLEAALVKVVTIASNIGAFKDQLDHNINCVLAEDSKWFELLDELIVNKNKRGEIGNSAYKKALNDYTTINTKYNLARFINSKLARNIAFVLPSTDISGGVNVVLKHAEILQDNGWDVTIIDSIDKIALKKAQKEYNYRLELPGYNVLTSYNTKMSGYFDTMVATLWSTLKYIKKYPNVKNRLYFVQNFETDFYEPGSGKLKFMSNATYSDFTNVKYITMSIWCQKWLSDRFNKDSKYCSNGINLEYYDYKKRDFNNKNKIKILIEGDSRSEYKNTDEAFRIVEKLDPAKFEVSYLSYRKEPKDWYRVDYFYNRITPDKVGEVYSCCDILLKTSLLESFSYPPLEMMATGGLSVVVPNDGNIEYLRDNENCLFYKQGNIEDGVSKIELLLSDALLRGRLIKGGLETAKKYEWANIEQDVIALYK